MPAELREHYFPQNAAWKFAGRKRWRPKLRLISWNPSKQHNSAFVSSPQWTRNDPGTGPGLIRARGGVGWHWGASVLAFNLAAFEVRHCLEEATNSLSISLDAAESRDSQQTKISPWTRWFKWTGFSRWKASRAQESEKAVKGLDPDTEPC